MRRIQIAEDDKKIMICETYITDTYDLFIVVNEDNIYKVVKQKKKFTVNIFNKIYNKTI